VERRRASTLLKNGRFALQSGLKGGGKKKGEEETLIWGRRRSRGEGLGKEGVEPESPARNLRGEKANLTSI